MTDLVNIISVAATIIFCHDSAPIVDNRCSDGFKPQKYTVNLLTKRVPYETLKMTSMLPEKSDELDAVFQLEHNDEIVFSVAPDGKISGSAGLDDASRVFWAAMAISIKNPKSTLCEGP